ncbi:MAG TPA: rhodanese-like domain-containing protein [Anaeromyxobacteraceae bacterium]|nr:rhodanese-like domain-containing protein [Anaeromyxobacteraceae bacterium]
MPTSPSAVLDTAPLAPEEGARYFEGRLAAATDPADVHADLAMGVPGLVVLDARSREAYERGHVPGALSLPHRLISPETVAALPRDAVLVTYCDGVHCNASTWAAVKLARLGFRVKEMQGGLEGWQRDGYELAVGRTPSSGGPR